MDFGLKGKTALVTGTALPHGIGRAIAVALAEEGVNMACADINGEGAEASAKAMKGIGVRAIALEVDQGSYEQVREAVEKAQRELGHIDILVNNAALLGAFALNYELDVSTWNKEININLSGPYYWVREVFNSMMKRNWGRIITISSIVGIMGGFGQSSYASSKGALVSFMKTVALEGAKYGITANAVSPGCIATDTFSVIDPGTKERIRQKIAMRKFGEPGDIGGVVAFLASERARYITGANIVVDGGAELYIF